MPRLLFFARQKKHGLGSGGKSSNSAPSAESYLPGKTLNRIAGSLIVRVQFFDVCFVCTGFDGTITLRVRNDFLTSFIEGNGKLCISSLDFLKLSVNVSISFIWTGILTIHTFIMFCKAKWRYRVYFDISEQINSERHRRVKKITKFCRQLFCVTCSYQ